MEEAGEGQSDPSESVFRGKRQVHDHLKNTCPLLLVADHRFFKYMGREEESTTLNYLVSLRLLFDVASVTSISLPTVLQIELIDRVDDIYRNTSWDDEFTGYGVQIHQVRREMDGDKLKS